MDDLAHDLDPIALVGDNLANLSTALVQALDVIAAFEAINVMARPTEAIDEAPARNGLETSSPWILDPDTLVFEDDDSRP